MFSSAALCTTIIISIPHPPCTRVQTGTNKIIDFTFRDKFYRNKILVQIIIGLQSFDPAIQTKIF